MNEEIKKEMQAEALSPDELDGVAGGRLTVARPPENYVTATCEHCGVTGSHLMDSGWTAICCNCGKTINLKAQG